MYLDYYKNIINNGNIPSFLLLYLECPTLKRLKKIGYFCGMDYASISIYDFPEYVSRFDHSLTTALIIYRLTHDKVATLAGLFHDAGTPCFSHVIDYMNKDYEQQESTEIYTEDILRSDDYLKALLYRDNIDIEEIINFKDYTVVDNKRPKLCADRLDGVILTSMFWSKNITKEEIGKIINSLMIYRNEENEEEIGFNNYEVAKLVMKLSCDIDRLCHENYDNYMMQLLANITRLTIERKYIDYEDLYILNEEELWYRFNQINDYDIKELINKFETITMDDIPNIKIGKIKERSLKPLVNGERIEYEGSKGILIK